MRLGVIADDFTGASDIALTLAEGGMRTVQYVGVPDGEAEAGVEAGVVALKSRTIPAADAVAASLAACEWMLAQGVEQVVFKVCSTFDSTPQGNIGPVAEALAGRLGERIVPVCPAFPATGRSVYMGHLFVGDRPLNESGMQDHPLTPMTDADLRRVLAAQTGRPVRHVPWPIVAAGPDALATALGQGEGFVICDAIADGDLVALGEAARDRRLLVGGSGIALGLPALFGSRPGAVPWTGRTGPGAILSGSCSRATRAQVAAHAGPAHEIRADEVVGGSVDVEALADWAVAGTDASLIYTSADPGTVAAAQGAFGRDRVASAIERFFSALGAALVRRGVVRLVVAGGETSGAVVEGLGARALSVGPRIAAGVPALALDDPPLALALKSGNFGGPDFFAEALARLAHG